MRPFSTIEPTAIRLDMPVNVSVKYDATNKLVNILLEKKYHSSTVYIAWEHKNALKLAQGLLGHFGSNAIVPKWHGNDYSTVFIFKINWKHRPTKIKFKVSKEKFPALSSRCS